MENAVNCTIVEGNADIAGVGVRGAVYVQAFLAILAIVYTAFRMYREDGKTGGLAAVEFLENNGRLLKQLAITLMLTGTALVVSAIIEARTSQLSVYHALIVLNLSWINSYAGFSLHFFAWFGEGLVQETSRWKQTRQLMVDLWVFFLHAGVMGVAGFLFWREPTKISKSPPECLPGTVWQSQTYYWILTHAISTESPALKKASQFVYFANAIPGLNVLLIYGGPVWLIVRVATLIIPRGGRLIYVVLTLAAITPVAYLIPATENLRVVNRDVVDLAAEENWTYGQTLALAAALASVLVLVAEFWRAIVEWRQGNRSWTSAGRKWNEVRKGRENNWVQMREVAQELEQISRRKLIQGNELVKWSDAVRTMDSVVNGRAEDWEGMRRVAGHLAVVSLNGMTQPED